MEEEHVHKYIAGAGNQSSCTDAGAATSDISDRTLKRNKPATLFKTVWLQTYSVWTRLHCQDQKLIYSLSNEKLLDLKFI